MARPAKEAATSSSLAPALVRLARARGASIETGFDAESDEAAVTPSGLAALLATVAEALAEPHLALSLPAALPRRRYDAATLAMMNAGTPREALQLVVQYAPLVFPALEARLDVDEAKGELLFHARIAGAPRGLGYHVDAYVLATALAHARRGIDLAPTRAWLSASRPTTLEPLFAALGTREVDLGSADLGFALRMTDGEKLLAGGDPTLLATAQHLASAALAAAPRASAFASAVAARIEAALPAVPSADDVAEALRVSPRTLQRRLEDEGTRFSAVTDGVRERVARRLLADASLPLAEVGYRTGFSDLATFSRAFKRWTGTPPGAFRRRAIR